MNLFSTDAFLETLAELYYPGRRWAVEVCRVEGRYLRLLVVGRREVVLSAPFFDYPQPVEDPVPGPVRELSWVPRTVLRTTTVEDRAPEPKGQHPSPFIDWSRFVDWADFERFVGARIGNLFPDSRRRRKKLERDLGPLRFEFDDPRPEVFDACVRWKSAQYVTTGLPDLFAPAENVELFRRLRRRGAVVVSSLSAGSTLLAVHFGGLADGKHSWWVPAYDAALSKYSPGRLLLEEILKESLARRHREFDFLIGDEAYKFHYATHVRVIGPVGSPPLRVRLWNEARARAKHALSGSPRLLEAARSFRRRLIR